MRLRTSRQSIWRTCLAVVAGAAALAACARVAPSTVEADLARLAAIEAAFSGEVETLNVRFGRAARDVDHRVTDEQVRRITTKTVALLRRGDNANTPADALSAPVYGEVSRAAKSLATTKASLAVCAQDEPALRAMTRFLARVDADARFAPPTTTPARLTMLKRYLRSNFTMTADEQRGVLSITRPRRRGPASEFLIAVDAGRRAAIPGAATLRCAQLVVHEPDAASR